MSDNSLFSEGSANDIAIESRVLAELELLASVEHALVVEYLVACYALGHDPRRGSRLCDVGCRPRCCVGIRQSRGQPDVPLRRSQRRARRGREIPDDGQTRQHQLRVRQPGRSLPGRCRGPRPAGSSMRRRPPPGSAAAAHGDSLANLADAFPRHGPPGLVQATRRQAANDFEQRLLDTSDHIYNLPLSSLTARFAILPREAAFAVHPMPRLVMDTLDDLNRSLLRRGLVPAFHLP